jgi:hypothetical protein
VPGDPPPTIPAVLSIDATAALVGQACWVESACFAVLGGWVPRVPEPVAKLLVARHSRDHGWHAELLAEVLPSTRAHHRAALVAPGDERWPAAIEAVRGPADGGTVERLAGFYQALLPRLVAGYDRTLETLSPWSDGPVARRLRLVADDERADLAEGLAVLESLVHGGADADRAARRRIEVEGQLPR